jgi:hypothetical protein
MDEVDQRLREALEMVSSEIDSIDGARFAHEVRRHARRRTWVLGVLTTAALATLAIPTALLVSKTSIPDTSHATGSQYQTEPSSEPGWTRLEYKGVTADLPPGWVHLDLASCRLSLAGPVYGPEGSNPCQPAQMLSIDNSSLFDPAYGPGVHQDIRSKTWSGYKFADNLVVIISADDQGTVQRVLDSVGPR